MALVTAPAAFIGALAEARFWLDQTDFETSSVLNAARQVLSYPSADHWRISLSTTLREGAGARDWRAFLLRLQGRSNWFQCPVPMFAGVSTGYSGPAAQVDGASQSGTVLLVKSIIPSADYLGAGDWFTVADQLFCAMGDVTADGTGDASITLNKPLRASPENNAALNITAPYFLCASTRTSPMDEQGHDRNRTTYTFEGREHIA